MDLQHKPRYSIPLAPGTTYRRPASPPDRVRQEDPALSVFTDFTRVMPRAVDPDTAIDTALDQMKEQGVRLLLVTDGDEVVTGLVTARDIQGENRSGSSRRTAWPVPTSACVM